eukprot:SAG31_NODE_4827_length_2922_cov_1.410556_6_plen_45_part_01
MYTRSILALNTIEAGGAGVWMSPGAVKASRTIVARLADQAGEVYH